MTEPAHGLFYSKTTIFLLLFESQIRQPERQNYIEYKPRKKDRETRIPSGDCFGWYSRMFDQGREVKYYPYNRQNGGAL